MRKLTLSLSFIIYSLSLVNAQSYTINTFAGNGGTGYSGDGGPATAAQIYSPVWVCRDTSGNIYISDGTTRIRKVNSSGIISTFAGNGSWGYSGDGGAATAAELNAPEGICIDSLGDLYIADELNNRIRMVNTSGIISTIVGKGTGGYSGDGGPATAAELGEPYGAFLDGSGNLYIGDGANQRIRKVNSGGIISTIAGNGVYGYSGDGGLATAAELFTPINACTDPKGNVYISDYGNHRIRMVNTSGIISTFAGNGVGGYSGDGGPATAAELYYPGEICFDGSGNLYIADTYNNRIRVVNTSGTISTIAGNGVKSFSGDGGPATAAEINYPWGVYVDSYGNIYIADCGNSRVRILTKVTTGIDELSENNTCMVYPNPCNGKFSVTVNSEKLKVNSVMEIYNMLGQQVYEASLNPSKGGTSVTTISLPINKSSIYIYKIVSQDGSILGEGKLLVER